MDGFHISFRHCLTAQLVKILTTLTPWGGAGIRRQEGDVIQLVMRKRTLSCRKAGRSLRGGATKMTCTQRTCTRFDVLCLKTPGLLISSSFPSRNSDCSPTRLSQGSHSYFILIICCSVLCIWPSTFSDFVLFCAVVNIAASQSSTRIFNWETLLRAV